MPVTPTYPGVYVEEIPSGVRTISGVATSITAFIGRAFKGKLDEPIRIQNFGDFVRQFGGLWNQSTMSYAVQQYFLNGGQDAIIIRVYKDTPPATPPTDAPHATLSLPSGTESLKLEAASQGSWGKALRAVVDHNTRTSGNQEEDAKLFNLTVQELEAPGSKKVAATETLRNLSIDPDSARFYKKVIEQESTLVNVPESDQSIIKARPDATEIDASTKELKYVTATGGSDGEDITDTEISADALKADRKGLYALDKADLFNLLCIPPLTRKQDDKADVTNDMWTNAAKYCKDKRAFLIVDPPSVWKKISDAVSGVDTLRGTIGADLATNAAIYFPRLKMADPLKENRTEEFAACGAIAGIFARTDSQRGIWKAPAGIEASVVGVRELSYKMNDGENGQLNPLGVNCVRNFPVYGNVLWGARTLAGADQLASEWKYVPVRRLALYLEESLYRGTQWVVFEPNDEPLWSQIRLNIGSFMNNLFKQGAFQGKTPKEAYFVKCDSETTTQYDIDRGIVNIVIGFAPLKPAEFVILKFQQIANESAA
ncbi:phage tail sheath family protein [Leptolyngbya sp. FACHB-671]|uniref:phage tail sheath family protein n=1 Tax=Leptolyngbya sp. FACHB-671 TaxID=2692812 RepID=UPI0016877922|nr:phage tail sheath C-terminal domain-containing protein [Leptolyngbya sp. FACHB-671]MBD2066016.1 phage tail sheath family protein [Leptolyngbya sp. FACHB-671]